MGQHNSHNNRASVPPNNNTLANNRQDNNTRPGSSQAFPIVIDDSGKCLWNLTKSNIIQI